MMVSECMCTRGDRERRVSKNELLSYKRVAILRLYYEGRGIWTSPETHSYVSIVTFTCKFKNFIFQIVDNRDFYAVRFSPKRKEWEKDNEEVPHTSMNSTRVTRIHLSEFVQYIYTKYFKINFCFLGINIIIQIKLLL